MTDIVEQALNDSSSSSKTMTDMKEEEMHPKSEEQGTEFEAADWGVSEGGSEGLLGSGEDQGDKSSVGSETRSKGENGSNSSRPRKPWVPPTLEKQPKVVRPRAQGKWKCPECDMTFTKPSLLNSHLEAHSEERPFKCPWEGCDSAFKRQQHLDRHYKTHTKEFDFICPWENCGRGFVEKWLLDEHYRSHLRKKMYKCEVEGCEREFPSQIKLRAHLTDHGIKRSYHCLHPGCDASYARLDGLERHMARVHADKTYPCKECGEVFQTKEDQIAHKATTHALHLECPDCGKVWNSQLSYNKHRKTHELERPVHQCPQCDKQFLSTGALAAHKRVKHDGILAFVCEVPDCGVAFAHKKTLVIHMKRDHVMEDQEIEQYLPMPDRKKRKLAEPSEEMTPEEMTSLNRLASAIRKASKGKSTEEASETDSEE